MPYRLCKTVEIENGHMLTKHPDKCKFPHGHSRKVEFVVEADELDQNDMVCDFKIVKEAMEGFLEQYDHAMCINTDDPKYADFKSGTLARIRRETRLALPPSPIPAHHQRARMGDEQFMGRIPRR